jgi:hypothetical protein
VPEEIVEDERLATMIWLALPEALARARAAYDGRMLVLKGPEAAARYPDATLRPFHDVDLLVDDAAAAQRALLAAGFAAVETGLEYDELHHLQPLRWESLPVVVELHRTVKWPPGSTPPDPRELFEQAVASSTGIDGLEAPAPAHHALVLAAHGWAHRPLSRLLDLVDVAAVSDEIDRDELAALAERWSLGRLWRSTLRVSDSLFASGRESWAQRVWARDLRSVRRRTVLEGHLEAWLSPFAAFPPRSALRYSARAVLADLRREPGEGWRRKLRRSRLAVTRAFRDEAEHERRLH